MGFYIVDNITPPHRRRGDSWIVKKGTGWRAILEENCWIRLLGCDAEGLFDRLFQVGDYVEYEAANVSSFGPIKAICHKHVRIQDRVDAEAGTGRGFRHLDLYTFAVRNIRWNLKETIQRNSDTLWNT